MRRDVEFKAISENYKEPFENTLNEILKTGDWRIVETEISEADHWYNAYLVRSEEITQGSKTYMESLELQNEKLSLELASANAELEKYKKALEIAKKSLSKLSMSGDGTHSDKHASFYDCLPTLQIEFDERKSFSSKALKEIEEVLK